MSAQAAARDVGVELHAQRLEGGDARLERAASLDGGSLQVGFALPAGATSTSITSLELFVDYVVVYPGDGTTPAVSRRQPVSLSLIDPSPSVPREDPDGAADDLGDRRNEARPRR